jgi:peptide deformylase
MSGSLRKITVVGDPVLSTPTRQVTDFGSELATLIDDMFASMAVAEGVGLAAPQVGVDLAVFVYDCPDESGERHRGHVVNPTIEVAGAQIEADEGCLSVPGPYHELERSASATVRGVDKTGAPVEVSGTGFFARCLQHETDHLRGVLYIDHLPRNRRRRVLREMEPFEWNVPSQ